MKKILFLMLCLICSIGEFTTVKASSDDYTLVENEEAFNNCIKNESACRLSNDLTITERKEISGAVILDLNGQTITPNTSLQLHSGLLLVNRNSTLVINDSKGTGKISTGSDDNVWAAIQLIKDNTGNEPAELIVNGGTIEGYYYGIVGNGTLHNTKITINNGVIKGLNTEDSAGIYQPQDGELIVNGGEISGGTGIEIRSGSLVFNNGTVKGIASRFVKVVNGNGTTTNGVGITVAQHTTKKPIKVSIHNGNIKGQYAFYEWNPHHNNEDALNKISINIYDGNFEGYAEGVSTIYSENFTNFVSGGQFNKNIDNYLTVDNAVFKSEKNPNKKNKSSLIIIISIAFIIGISLFIFLKQKKLHCIK